MSRASGDLHCLRIPRQQARLLFRVEDAGCTGAANSQRILPRVGGADGAEGLPQGGPGTGCSPHVLSAPTLVSTSFYNQGNKFKVRDILLEFGALSLISLTPAVSKDRIKDRIHSGDHRAPGRVAVWAGLGWPVNSSSFLQKPLPWPGAHI